VSVRLGREEQSGSTYREPLRILHGKIWGLESLLSQRRLTKISFGRCLFHRVLDVLHLKSSQKVHLCRAALRVEGQQLHGKIVPTASDLRVETSEIYLVFSRWCISLLFFSSVPVRSHTLPPTIFLSLHHQLSSYRQGAHSRNG